MAEADAGPPPTSAVLMSISKHIAVRCKKPNTAFIECKKADRNPEACLRQGNAVTSCTIDVYAPPRRCTSCCRTVRLAGRPPGWQAEWALGAGGAG